VPDEETAQAVYDSWACHQVAHHTNLLGRYIHENVQTWQDVPSMPRHSAPPLQDELLYHTVSVMRLLVLTKLSLVSQMQVMSQ
jgi:hypothetical protein